MKLDEHYVDPRLVALYDTDNPRGADTEFYLDLATRLNAQIFLDLGCGTGLLTRGLATAGRQVIGIDPAPAMLAYARSRPGADKVEWIEGDAAVLGRRGADLLLMTGNVAQVFLEDAEWDKTLHAIYAALKPGGHLAFESRNPAAKAWESWNREQTYEKTHTPFGPLECWLELVSVGHGRVHFQGHNIFAGSGEDVVVDSELRFRSQAELQQSLRNAGFAIEHIYGGWGREPVEADSKVFVFVAARKC